MMFRIDFVIYPRTVEMKFEFCICCGDPVHLMISLMKIQLVQVELSVKNILFEVVAASILQN